MTIRVTGKEVKKSCDNCENNKRYLRNPNGDRVYCKEHDIGYPHRNWNCKNWQPKTQEEKATASGGQAEKNEESVDWEAICEDLCEMNDPYMLRAGLLQLTEIVKILSEKVERLEKNKEQKC